MVALYSNGLKGGFYAEKITEIVIIIYRDSQMTSDVIIFNLMSTKPNSTT